VEGLLNLLAMLTC